MFLKKRVEKLEKLLLLDSNRIDKLEVSFRRLDDSNGNLIRITEGLNNLHKELRDQVSVNDRAAYVRIYDPMSNEGYKKFSISDMMGLLINHLGLELKPNGFEFIKKPKSLRDSAKPKKRGKK